MTRRVINTVERSAIESLGRVTFPPATNCKRFAHNVAGAQELTERQIAYLWHLVWKFRRQIPSESLVDYARKQTLPNVEGAILQ